METRDSLPLPPNWSGLVPLSLLNVDPSRNVRSGLDPQSPEIAALRDSIVEYGGNFTPVLVSLHGDLLAGYRRHAAVVAAHLPTIFVTTRADNDEVSVLRLKLDENIRREELSSYDKSRSLYKLFELYRLENSDESSVRVAVTDNGRKPAPFSVPYCHVLIRTWRDLIPEIKSWWAENPYQDVHMLDDVSRLKKEKQEEWLRLKSLPKTRDSEGESREPRPKMRSRKDITEILALSKERNRPVITQLLMWVLGEAETLPKELTPPAPVLPPTEQPLEQGPKKGKGRPRKAA